MGLAVIGAGFGRTGTFSLKLALETLGVGPCFHMAELFAEPRGEELKRRWEAVAFADPPPDWDDVFAGFRATVDWPAAAYWRALARHYPDAKVILTIRDPESWYESAAATIFSGRSSAEEIAQRTDPWARMVWKIIGQGTFDGRTGDREHAMAVFRAHNAAVECEIPADRLLVYRAGDGWEPLCRFLGAAVPDTPYPRENTTRDFQAERDARAQAEAAAKAGPG